MTDPSREASLALRLSVTDRCQLRCLYCTPLRGLAKLPREDILTFEEIVRFVHLVKRSFGLSKVRLTGGEPLLRPGLVDLVEMLASEGVADLALTTNGERLGRMAAPLRRAGLRRVNISLDSLDRRTFAEVTRGGDIGLVLEGVEAALRHGLAPVKLNVTVLRNINDGEVVDVARYGLERGCHVRFLELMPIGPAAARHEEWFVSSEEVRQRLAGAFELRPAPTTRGGTSRDFVATDGRGREGTVGFISSCTAPFCRGCARLRLTPCGDLIGCLAEGRGASIRALLRRGAAGDEESLVECVAQAFRLKRRGQRFRTSRPMVTIGG